MDYKSETKQRSAILYPSENGRLQVNWTLTDTKLTDAVRLTVPPSHAIPIVFIPGIMGSNLCTLQNNPVWLLNSVGNTPVGLALKWAPKAAGQRQRILHPRKTKVFKGGAVPKVKSPSMRTLDDFIQRGWGEVSEASYHKFLLWLDSKMNSDGNPANWTDFTHSSLPSSSSAGEKLSARLPAGLEMEMPGLPKTADGGSSVGKISSDELIKRSKAVFPVYAFGYNWLGSNSDAASSLMKRIECIIQENNSGPMRCKQVILVTHSMGGLVARACSQLPSMSEKILGIVHGVMPATGAAVAYRRCKVGMRDENFGAGLVIGSNGKEVTAVFAQAPGALQLLPSEDYGAGWLKVADSSKAPLAALPVSDPYKEIYLERESWWGLVREEWLSPDDGEPIDWNIFSKNILIARAFHRSIAKKYHRNTYVFYGGGIEKKSFEKICWNIKNENQGGYQSGVLSLSHVVKMRHEEIVTDGSNNLYIEDNRVRAGRQGGDNKPTSHKSRPDEKSGWIIQCAGYDSAGDGTVPKISGAFPLSSGGMCVKQQFELSGIEHEPAYRDSPVAQTVAYYAITKLAAIADFS